MKFLKDKQTRHDFVTYAMCVVAFAIVFFMQSNHMIPRMIAGQLVPITAYIVMAISLNLVVGIAGDLSLGHAGFMSVGAYTGIVTAVALESAVPSDPVRLIISIVVGAIAAAILGFLIGIPVLRLSGDYLAIVTLAFGEIIKEIVTCLIVGVDSRGLHVIFNITGNSTIDDLHLLEDGTAIIKGAQGASGVSTYSTFLAGAILVMVALVIVLNLVRSRTGRAIMAVSDNKIAAESVGISVTQYRMIAFVVSAALAGAAGALFGGNFSQLSATKFDFNTSILILVFVVLGGLGNMRGSVIAAALLTVLPELLRQFSDYRMLIYARADPGHDLYQQSAAQGVLRSRQGPLCSQEGGGSRCPVNLSSTRARWSRILLAPSFPIATWASARHSSASTWASSLAALRQSTTLA